MKDEIIEYLNDKNTGNKIVLNDFLKTLLTTNNQKILQPVLMSLDKEKLVDFDGMIGHIGERTYEIENHIFKGALTAAGIQEAKEIKRRKRQDQLLEEQAASIVATNQSIQATNVSTRANFVSQRKFANRSLWLAGISSVFILVTIIQSIVDKTPQRLQDIETQLKNQSQESKNIHTSLEKINSSMKKLTTDTVLVKRKK